MSDLNLNSYYFAFEETGVVEVDRILAEVAGAAHAYHHVEHWNEPEDEDGLSRVEQIQVAANEAAGVLRTLRLFRRQEGE